MRIRGRIAAVVVALSLVLTGCSLSKPPNGTNVGPVSCTGGAVAPWTEDQTNIARAIVQVALGLNLGEQGAVIGVAVGITESTLASIDYGDTMANGQMSSSRGPFQQLRTWGPLADRLDPTKSATMFFTGGQAGQKGLIAINGSQSIPPHVAAQAVQQSQFADGSNFARNVPAAQALVTAIMATCKSPGAGGVNIANGVSITLPNNEFVAEAVRGKTITAPSDAVAKGLAAGFDQLGLPYVWGGGGSGAGANDGCARGGGQLNSCQGLIGFDCSGLTAFVLGQSGYQIPGDSGSQRGAGQSVPVDQALPGDIYGFPGHVSISLGTIDGVAYHLEASTPGTAIHIVPMRRGDVDGSAHRYWTPGPATAPAPVAPAAPAAPAAYRPPAAPAPPAAPLPAVGAALPSGIVGLTDFKVGPAGYVVTDSLQGAGMEATTIRMNPHTSTKAGMIPTAHMSTNPLSLVTATGSPTLSDFTLAGSDQGHLYNGLRIQKTTNARISNVRIVGIPGDSASPPGETFMLNDYGSNGNVYSNIVLDGQNVSAAGFGVNSSDNLTINGLTSINNRHSSAITFWQSGNVVMNDFNADGNHKPINMEQNHGWFVFNRPRFGSSATGMDLSTFSTIASTPVTINDPILAPGQRIIIQPYQGANANGGPNKQLKSDIRVYVGGVDKTDELVDWRS